MFNKTLVARRRHYMDHLQTDWNVYMQEMTYGYNTQIHRTTNI